MKRVPSAIIVAILALPEAVFASSTPQTFSQLADQIVQILGSATTDLIVLAIVVYFWGVSINLFKQGEKGHSELRKQLIWGVVVIFVAVSIWGIVQILQTTVFGSGASGSTGRPTHTCTSLTGCSLGQ